MRILLTGGAGFIGSHVADLYIKEGHEVLIIDNLSSGRVENINKNAEFEEVDIRDYDALLKVFNRFKPDIVNHHAAQISVVYSMQNPNLDIDINIKGTLNLLELSRVFKIKKFIFASTGGALYGEPIYLPSDETHPILPLAPYGIDKEASEHYIRIYANTYKFDFVILRYANVYGPRQDPFGEAGVVAIFTKRMLEGKECFIFGNGEQKRDFVFVQDVAQANLLALNYAPKNGILPVFNIGTGRLTSVNTLFGTLCKLTGYEKEPVYKPKREGEVFEISLSYEKAKKHLGWQPTYTLGKGLLETVNWFKQKGG